MKSWIYLFCVLALTFLPAARGIAADDMSGTVSMGVEGFGGDEDNAKFNEYRYQNNSRYGASLDMRVHTQPETSHRYTDFLLDARTPEDLDFSLRQGSQGFYKFNLDFTRMGHNFAFDVPTLYIGAGTDALSVVDSIRQASLSTSTIANVSNYLLHDAKRIDLSLKRDTFASSLEWMCVKPFTFGVDLSREKRDGTRPFGGTFGFGQAVEIPEPIHYTTTDYGFRAEYAGNPYYASVNYAHSTFNDQNVSFTYENPFLLASTTGESAIARNSLPPDNSYDSVTSTLSALLPVYNTRATLNVAYGYSRQDDDLMPVTINDQYTASLLPLPANSVDAQVDNRLYDLTLTSRPMERFHVKARYKYDQHRNKTDELAFSEYFRTDYSNEGAATPVYVSYVKRTGELELDYEVAHRTTVTVGYENENNSFSNGSANSESENIYKLSINSRAWDKLTGRLDLELSDKDSDYPDYDPAVDSEVPGMRKFYAAPRDRFKASAAMTYLPNDVLDVNLDLSYAKDDYRDSAFGLLDDKTYTGTVDVGYEVNKNLRLNGFYTYENMNSLQRSFQWSSAVPDLTFSASQWTVDVEDIVHTIGFGAEIGIIENLLDMNLDGTYTKSNGRADFASPLGTSAADDQNFYVPGDFGNVDDTKMTTLGAKLNYKLTKAWSTTLGYRFQKWDIEDYQYDGLTIVYVNPNNNRNNVTMDTLYKPYTVNTIYVTATYSF